MGPIILIPARRGEKNKNAWLVNGAGLTVRAASTAKLSGLPVWISTDLPLIEGSGVYEEVAIHRRAPEFCTGKIPVHKWVLEHFLPDCFTGDRARWPSIICLVQPTSPFLTSQDIRDVVKRLEEDPELASCQTVARVAHNSHEWNQRRFVNSSGAENFNLEFAHKKERSAAFNSQLKPARYTFGNVVATRVEHLERGFFVEPSAGLQIPRLNAFDVDDEEDLEMADALARQLNL